MTRSLLAGALAASAVLVAVACVEREPQAPVAPSFAAQGGQCSFNTANQLAGDYFSDNTTLQDVRALINDMKQAGAGTLTARSKGFDVFVIVGANVGANPNHQAGSDLVNALIRCMQNDAEELPLTFPEDFTTALDPDQNGAFAVRGLVTDGTDAVFAANKFSGVLPVGGDWTASLSGNTPPNRVLIYGKPGSQSEFHYDWRTFPHNAEFDPQVVIAFCIDALGANLDKMVQGNSAGDISYLAFKDAGFMDPLSDCSPTNVALDFWSPRTLAGNLFLLGAELFGPHPLAATSVLEPGGLGGTAGGIRTEYGPEAIDTVVLRFVTQPKKDVRVCAATPCVGDQNLGTVVVEATRNGDPVGGVSIDLGAINNNGNFLVLLGDHPQTTNEDGLATFDELGITKPGGYQLVTTITFVEGRSTQIVIVPATSRKGNVRP